METAVFVAGRLFFWPPESKQGWGGRGGKASLLPHGFPTEPTLSFLEENSKVHVVSCLQAGLVGTQQKDSILSESLCRLSSPPSSLQGSPPFSYTLDVFLKSLLHPSTAPRGLSLS